METVVRFLALLLTALVLTGLPGRATANQQDFDTCRTATNADSAIAGCTRVIDDQRLRPEVRAEAYWNRGEANVTTGQKERAIGDYTEDLVAAFRPHFGDVPGHVGDGLVAGSDEAEAAGFTDGCGQCRRGRAAGQRRANDRKLHQRGERSGDHRRSDYAAAGEGLFPRM